MPLILLHDDDLQLLTTRELRRYISSVCDQVRQLAFDLAWHQATSAER